MQPPLKNANGYRSPYINALNAAATANEVVAGDLAIHRTPQGTTLRIPPRPRLRRFRLTLGYLASTPVALLSEGNLILATGRAALLPGKDVAWSDATGPNPGWYSTALPTAQDHWLDVILAQHIPTGAVYVVFQPGAGEEPAAPLHQLLPADLGTLAETDVAAIVTIGRFFIPASTSSSASNAIQIAQYIADDIPALGLATPTPFNHRFKVTAETVTDDNGQTSVSVRVNPGTIWERVADTLAPIGLTPVAPLAADRDGWKVDNATSASLYITEKDDGAHEIKFSDPAAETSQIILRIADVTVTADDPPAASVLQRQIGDFVLAAPGQEAPPVAWRVALRSKSVSSGTIDQWQIFAPTWTVGRETLLPEGMAEDWNDLDIHSGDLYAVLTWTGTATTDDAGEVKTTWTPGKPIITNDLSAIPADEDPTPDDPSTSTIEGKEGHRSIIVKIGTFITDDSEPPAEGEESEPPAEGEEPDPIGFLQIHTGSIIEDLNTSTPANAGEEPIDNPAAWEVRAFKEEQEDGTKRKVWKVWSPTFTAGNQTIYSKDNNGNSTKAGWNTISYNTNGWLYAIIRLRGNIERDFDGTRTVRWHVYETEMRFYIRDTAGEIRPPTQETSGIREVSVRIGKFYRRGDTIEFEQYHLGSIVAATGEGGVQISSASYQAYEPYHETAILPTAFAITEDGKLEITTRNIKTPIAQTDNDDKILLDLPAGGGSSDQLGPIEFDSSQNAYVQYLGKWTWTGSAWTFAKKMNGNVAYPPAAVYSITAAQLLVRANQYGNPDAAGNNIAVIPFNLPFASATATNWLTKQESTVSNGVVYTPPETVDGSGSLDSKTFTITYWSDTGETNAQTANLLGSIVEGANESSTYEG